MIPRKTSTLQIANWQKQLSTAIDDPLELAKLLDLPTDSIPTQLKAHQQFPLRVTHSFISRMEKGNRNDPLLLQILPVAEEMDSNDTYSLDPVGDKHSEKTPGLLHKYHGRVLLTLTGACALHCRYCFRRHFDYAKSNPTKSQWQNCLDYIRSDEEIYEIILSGGDPLSLSDHRLGKIINDLENIKSVTTIRIHTRQLIALPDRVSKSLLELISNSSKKFVIVVHINHPNEINQQVQHAMQQLKAISVDLLNQSVLLHKVNDNANCLIELSKKLFSIGVIPYYLHLLDKVHGATHFETSEHTALLLMEKLRESLPGYLVPRLVRETSGEAFKTPIF